MDDSRHAPALVHPDVYAERRARVMEALGTGAALIVSASPEIVVGRDTEQRYVIDPELYYLTGYREPEAVAVLVPGSDVPFTLFVRPRDAARELWTGTRGGVEAATATFGAQAAHPISELGERLPELVSKVDRIFARVADDSPSAVVVRNAIATGRRTRARTGTGPSTIIDPGVLLDDLRRSKDEHEISALRRAASITVDAFIQAIAQVRPGKGEWEIEAVLEAGFRARGADGWAFPSIVAGGANATVLHYVANDKSLRDGDLMLIDAGARYQMYCADITRTVPINGRFSNVQRTVYDVVLAAHDAAIDASRPGRSIHDIHEAAMRVMADGVKSLGLTSGSDEEAVEQAVRKYYPHKTSHWLGLEVHDVGGYVTTDAGVPLAEGMVYTIEPGLYIPVDDLEAPAELRGLGIRIEDDVLITANGHEVLTGRLPTSAEQVERLSGAMRR